MVNKCVVVDCSTGYSTGERKPSFVFPDDEELRKKWIYFVNRKNWKPSKYSVIYADYFEEKFIKYGKKCRLRWELHPVLTINSNLNDKPSLLKTPTISQKLLLYDTLTKMNLKTMKNMIV